MATDNDRREQILDAALKVFAEHGFHKASIKQIARAAQIKSSALIYWYFEDKAALMQAVIAERSPLRASPALNPDMRAFVFAQPPEVVLTQIAANVLSLQDDPDSIRMMRLYIGEAVRNPDVANAVADFQIKMSGFLQDYLEHQIALGALKPHDCAVSSRAFIGTVLINILGTQVFTEVGASFPDRETYITQVVQIFLKGIGNA